MNGPDCPMCGHAVKVVGRTTQHYEPIGCYQLVDDHQVCDEEAALLRSLLRQVVMADHRGHGVNAVFGSYHVKALPDALLEEIEAVLKSAGSAS